MSKEVKEEFQRFRKEEVGHLFTFYASDNIVKAAGKWKGKSVSFKSPKSGRILRIKKSSDKGDPKTNEKEKGKDRFSLNRWSKLFNDFNKAKVADFEYQQPKVRESSSYKPFWATKVVQAFRRSSNDLSVPKTDKSVAKTGKSAKNSTISFIENEKYSCKKSSSMFMQEERSLSIFENEIESLTISKQVSTVETTNDVTKGFSFANENATTPKFTLSNKGFTFVKDASTAPSTAKVKVGANVKPSPDKKLSNVEFHPEHRLALPPFFKGSKMFMPTGERLYWVGDL